MQNVSAQKVIRFEIDSTTYGINGRPPCQEDHIEFFNGLDSDSMSLGRFCKTSVPDPITVSTGAARVVFEGRIKPNRPASRKGVRVVYEIQGKVFLSRKVQFQKILYEKIYINLHRSRFRRDLKT